METKFYQKKILSTQTQTHTTHMLEMKDKESQIKVTVGECLKEKKLKICGIYLTVHTVVKHLVIGIEEERSNQIYLMTVFNALRIFFIPLSQ